MSEDKVSQVAKHWLQSLERQLFVGGQFDPGVCTNTCASEPEPPSLTVDKLMKTMQELRGMLPVVWYRFCKWIPDELASEPCYALGFKFGEDDVLFVHPGKLDTVRQLLGPCNLIEYPQERMEEQATLEAIRNLAGPLFDDYTKKTTKRVRDREREFVF